MMSEPILDLLGREMSSGVAISSLIRLAVAAFLGGVIGLERQLKRRRAGLRTTMFICFGSALFTVLSRWMAPEHSDYTRIAAQIIPGIGFIGAGSILHSRGLTSGITTAATIFVVASVGMAVGAGLYLTAIFATIVVLIALLALGHLEVTFNLKDLLITYEVSSRSAEDATKEINRILEQQHRVMENVVVANTAEHVRIQFDVDARNRDQSLLLENLKSSRMFLSVASLGPVERE